MLLKEQPGNLVYALYAGEGTPRPSGHVYVGGDLDTRGPAALPLNAWSRVYNRALTAADVQADMARSVVPGA